MYQATINMVVIITLWVMIGAVSGKKLFDIPTMLLGSGFGFILASLLSSHGLVASFVGTGIGLVIGWVIIRTRAVQWLLGRLPSSVRKVFRIIFQVMKYVLIGLLIVGVVILILRFIYS